MNTYNGKVKFGDQWPLSLTQKHDSFVMEWVVSGCH